MTFNQSSPILEKMRSVFSTERAATLFSRLALNASFPIRAGKAVSPYGSMLRESRKMSLLYGNLSKKYLQKIFRKSGESPSRRHETIFFLLESRLDVVLYRAAFFESIAAAKQMIRWGQITVNSKKVISPGYIVVPGDLIRVLHTKKTKKVVAFLQSQRYRHSLQMEKPKQNKGALSFRLFETIFSKLQWRERLQKTGKRNSLFQDPISAVSLLCQGDSSKVMKLLNLTLSFKKLFTLSKKIEKESLSGESEERTFPEKFQIKVTSKNQEKTLLSDALLNRFQKFKALNVNNLKQFNFLISTETDKKHNFAHTYQYKGDPYNDEGATYQYKGDPYNDERATYQYKGDPYQDRGVTYQYKGEVRCGSSPYDEGVIAFLKENSLNRLAFLDTKIFFFLQQSLSKGSPFKKKQERESNEYVSIALKAYQKSSFCKDFYKSKNLMKEKQIVLKSHKESRLVKQLSLLSFYQNNIKAKSREAIGRKKSREDFKTVLGESVFSFSSTFIFLNYIIGLRKQFRFLQKKRNGFAKQKEKSFFKDRFLLDSKKAKPLHLEVGYRSLSIVFLFPPQRIAFPTFMNPSLIYK